MRSSQVRALTEEVNMTLDKKITLCENLTPVEVRIGNYIMNLEPLITEVTRFLGTGFF